VTIRAATGGGLLLLAGLLAPGSVVLAVEAGAEAAQVTIERITQDILSAMAENRDQIETEPELLYRLIDRILLPHFDFVAMTRLALGKYWREASANQQTEFVEQFRRLLVNTHAVALLEYSGQEIRYLPMRPSSRPGRATVRAELISDDRGDAVILSYRLRQHDGRWWVYDVAIDGISLLTNYRATFATIVRNRGIEGLIEDLREHNRRRDGAGAKAVAQ
jgi:phospholipid transport system substrate-binding protein